MRCGHLQYAGADWSAGHALQYHIYVIPENVDKKDAIAFTHGTLIGQKIELYGTDESETSGAVFSGSEKDDTKSCIDSDLGYPRLRSGDV